MCEDTGTLKSGSRNLSKSVALAAGYHELTYCSGGQSPFWPGPCL